MTKQTAISKLTFVLGLLRQSIVAPPRRSCYVFVAAPCFAAKSAAQSCQFNYGGWLSGKLKINIIFIMVGLGLAPVAEARGARSGSSELTWDDYSWKKCPSGEVVEGKSVNEVIANDFKNALLLGFSSDSPSKKLLHYPFRLIHIPAASLPGEVIGKKVTQLGSPDEVELVRVEKMASQLREYRATFAIHAPGYENTPWTFTFVRPSDPGNTFGPLGCAELNERPFLLRLKPAAE